MSKIGQAEGATVGIAPAAVLGSALLKGAGIWMRGNGEILSALEALMAGCIGPRREAFHIWSRSLEKMCECRSPVDLIRVQQDWLCDAVRLTACDIGLPAGDTAVSTKEAAAGVDKTVGSLANDLPKMRRGKPETS
jgi:hypothetical protein